MSEEYDYITVEFPVVTRLAIPKNEPLTEEVLHKALMEYLQNLADSNDGSEFLANLSVKASRIEPLHSRYD